MQGSAKQLYERQTKTRMACGSTLTLALLLDSEKHTQGMRTRQGETAISWCSLACASLQTAKFVDEPRLDRRLATRLACPAFFAK